MERVDYRPILEDLAGFFGSKRVLSIADVSAYTGMCYRTVVRKLQVSKNGITTVALARKLASL